MDAARPWWKRVIWLIAIWAVSVAAVGVVAGVLRWWLAP